MAPRFLMIRTATVEYIVPLLVPTPRERQCKALCLAKAVDTTYFVFVVHSLGHIKMEQATLPAAKDTWHNIFIP